MPGTTVRIGTRPGAADLGDAPGATYFTIGLTDRGDTTKAVLVHSLSDFVEKFGPRVTYGAVYDDLEAYFNEGGTQAYVARVVGPAAALATLTLVDRAGGAGVATLRVDAASPGAWGAGLSVQIDDGSAANTFKLTVLEAGVAQEVYNNLADPATAAAFVNARSSRVVLTNLASASTTPTNNPKVLVATALAGGNDDRASVTATLITNAAARFTPDLGPGAIATPGFDAATVGPALIAHGLANNRLALLAPPIATTTSGARTAVVGLRTLAGSEGAGIFYPWVLVPNGAGGTRTISPEGYIAGIRARTQVAVGDAGPSQAPAGEFGRARHVIGLESELDRATSDSLNDDNVNVIRRIAGTVRLMGWRSLSTDEANYRFLSARDLLCYIGALGKTALDRYVFRTIDGRGHLFTEIANDLLAIVDPIATAGGLFAKSDAAGRPVDPGYRIDTGPGVNTVPSMQRGEVRANLAVRPSPTGELIILSITSVPLTQAI